MLDQAQDQPHLLPLFKIRVNVEMTPYDLTKGRIAFWCK
jgi:hypothetical protein